MVTYISHSQSRSILDLPMLPRLIEERSEQSYFEAASFSFEKSKREWTKILSTLVFKKNLKDRFFVRTQGDESWEVKKYDPTNDSLQFLAPIAPLFVTYLCPLQALQSAPAAHACGTFSIQSAVYERHRRIEFDYTCGYRWFKKACIYRLVNTVL